MNVSAERPGLVSSAMTRMAESFSSLKVWNYKVYFWGQVVSVTGNFMQMLAMAFFTLELTHSGSALGWVTGIRLLPYVLLGPMGGVIADRYNKRKMLYFTQASQAVGALVLAILSLVHLVNFPVLLILSFILGCFTVLDNPARQSFIPELVPGDMMINAVALNSISMNIARILGSVLGGTLVEILGAPLCFLLNAVSFIAVIISLKVMHTSEIQVSPPVPRAKGQVREGMRYALKTPDLAIPLIMLTITGTLVWEFPTTLPLLATEAFHGSASTYGWMSALMAVGAIIGGLIVANRRGKPSPQSLAIICIYWGVVITVAALAPNLVICCILLIFVGYGSISFNSASKTTLQLSSSPEFRGRVMSLWALAWGGTTVIGAPLVGWIAEAWGSPWGLIVGGVPTVVLGLVTYPYLRKRTIRLREQEQQRKAAEASQINNGVRDGGPGGVNNDAAPDIDELKNI